MQIGHYSVFIPHEDYRLLGDTGGHVTYSNLNV